MYCMLRSLYTGAAIVPSYVFGGTDFFHNLSTDPRFKVIADLSRKLKMGLTLFWGPFYLPVSHILLRSIYIRTYIYSLHLFTYILIFIYT